MQTEISRPSKMGAVVTRRQKLAKQYAIIILREDMAMTWEKVGKAMGMNPRVCNELYLKAIKDETLDKDLFRLLWV
jgi:phage terminase small subunit